MSAWTRCVVGEGKEGDTFYGIVRHILLFINNRKVKHQASFI